MVYVYICLSCKKRIVTGMEEMIVDDRDNKFHKTCADALLAKSGEGPTLHFPSVVFDAPPPLPPPEPPPFPAPTYPFRCQRCGSGIAATAPRSCSRCYLDLCSACEAAGCCGSRPASIGEKTFCSVCARPCRSMCGYCKRYVHNSYGMFSQNCGGAHEQTCPEAAAARSVSAPKPSAEVALLKDIFKLKGSAPVRAKAKGKYRLGRHGRIMKKRKARR